MKKVLLPWPTNKAFAAIIEDAKTELTALQQIAEVDTSPITSEQEWYAKSEDVSVTMRPGIKLESYPSFLQQAKELKMI